MNAILVVNAGSSSVKFALYEPVTGSATPRLLGKGQVAQSGSEVELRIQSSDGTPVRKSRKASARGFFDYDEALRNMLTWLDEQTDLNLVAVGHRVVHGGMHYSAPVRVDERVYAELQALEPLAPLHQPQNLQAIRLIQQRLPAVPQVACFDTAFHSSQSALEQAFALPREITGAGVRRYGFHGLSYEYLAGQLPSVLGDKAQGRVILAHLGNGASLCALHQGKSVASTMGFSALDGLVMGTRCGSLDPGVILYLLQQLKMTPEQLSELLYQRSGLLGVSGISSDMQVLLDSPEPRASDAVALFVHRIVCEIGALAAAMGGLDALVFSAGIGEHAAPIRVRVAQGCAWLGAILDVSANDQGQTLIHTPESRLALVVLPTDEESVIAGHAARQIGIRA